MVNFLADAVRQGDVKGIETRADGGMQARSQAQPMRLAVVLLFFVVYLAFRFLNH
jgi:hypothetical protein